MIATFASAHMVAMKITGYMQLKPEHIDYDEQTRTVRLTKAARGWQHTVYPTAEMAAVAPGSKTARSMLWRQSCRTTAVA